MISKKFIFQAALTVYNEKKKNLQKTFPRLIQKRRDAIKKSSVKDYIVPGIFFKLREYQELFAELDDDDSDYEDETGNGSDFDDNESFYGSECDDSDDFEFCSDEESEPEIP